LLDGISDLVGSDFVLLSADRKNVLVIFETRVRASNLGMINEPCELRNLADKVEVRSFFLGIRIDVSQADIMPERQHLASIVGLGVNAEFQRVCSPFPMQFDAVVRSERIGLLKDLLFVVEK
jgi:hypothetical protein